MMTPLRPVPAFAVSLPCGGMAFWWWDDAIWWACARFWATGRRHRIGRDREGRWVATEVQP